MKVMLYYIQLFSTVIFSNKKTDLTFKGFTSPKKPFFSFPTPFIYHHCLYTASCVSLTVFKRLAARLVPFYSSVLCSLFPFSVFASCGMCREDVCITSKCNINNDGRLTPPSFSLQHNSSLQRKHTITSGIF